MANEPQGLLAFIAAKLGLNSDVAPAEAEQSLAEVLESKDAQIEDLKAKLTESAQAGEIAKVEELQAQINDYKDRETSLEAKVVELTHELSKVKSDLDESINQSIELEKAKIDAQKLAAEAILKANTSPAPSNGAETGAALVNAIATNEQKSIKYSILSSTK